MRKLRSLAIATVVVAGCSDQVGPLLRCVNNCVESVGVEPHTVIALPGDTLRYTATLSTIGTVQPGVLWSATPANVIEIDSTGRAVVRAGGLANVNATPRGDRGTLGVGIVWSVAGDTNVFPIFTGFDDPATGDATQPYSTGDSVVIGLTYLIGVGYSGPPVSKVELTITGPGIDTTFAAPATAPVGRPGVVQIRFGNPRRRAGVPVAALYNSRAGFGLVGGGHLQSPITYSTLPF